MPDLFTDAERDRIWETALRQLQRAQAPTPEPPEPPAEEPATEEDPTIFAVAMEIYCALQTAGHHERLNERGIR